LFAETNAGSPIRQARPLIFEANLVRLSNFASLTLLFH
jgi:hypothetical protein